MSLTSKITKREILEGSYLYRRAQLMLLLLLAFLMMGLLSDWQPVQAAGKTNHSYAKKWAKNTTPTQPTQQRQAPASPKSSAAQSLPVPSQENSSLMTNTSMASPLHAGSQPVSPPGTQATSGVDRSPQSLQVKRLEEALFVASYEMEPMTSRLNRLEDTVFAKTYSQYSVPDRITRLEKVVTIPRPDVPLSAQNADFGDAPAQPVAAPSPSSDVSSQRAVKPTPPSGNATERLTALEQFLLNRTYPKEGVLQRLSRLENVVYKSPQAGAVDVRLKALDQTVFGQPQSSEAVSGTSAPLDYTAGAYPPAYPTQYSGYDGMTASNAPPPLYTPPPRPGYVPVPSTGSMGSGGLYAPPTGNPGDDEAYEGYYDERTNPADAAAQRQDMQAALSQLEQDVLKQSYPAEPIPARLSRLENKVFHQTSPEMSEQDRLDRLIAVAAAGGEHPGSPAATGRSWQTLIPFLIMIPLMLL